MQKVTIHWKNGKSTEVPVANLENTTRLLEGDIKHIDYGKASLPPATNITVSKPDMTWKKPKLLKYAKSKGVEVQDNDTKSMILKAIGNV